ncbi:MAG: histidinol-phosphate transaminase [Flavobacteriaceae bacterium]
MSVLNLVRENIKAIIPYSSARDEFTDFNTEMVFLDANENPFETQVNRYPDPQQQSVKQLLSEQKDVPKTNILLGNGSDEVLDLLFRVFCEPNKDNIITLPPTYGMYNVLANINAITTKDVFLTSDFQPAVVQILAAADANSKLLFLCSPNNPTGNSFNTFEVESLLKTFMGIVVIDEAYIDFSETNSWLDRLDEFPNLVITQTLSKAYGMAGIRLGVCYASAEIISVLNSIKPPYNVNQLTQLRAIERLKNLEKVRTEIELIKTERTRLIKELEQINFVKKIYPTDANFVLIQVDNSNKRYDQLIAKGIVVRNRSKQVLCDNCLRLTIGTSEENKRLIETLKTL